MFFALRKLIAAKLGRCPKCFRASLAGAVFGWIAVAILASLPAKPVSYWLIVAFPVSFTALWLLHMFTFAGRVAFVNNISLRASPKNAIARRQALAIFVGGLCFAILASVPLRARADCNGQCGDSGCPNTPYDCQNGTCCAGGQSYALFCGAVDCNVDNPPPAYQCYDPDLLTDEQYATLRDCCSPLLTCR